MRRGLLALLLPLPVAVGAMVMAASPATAQPLRLGGTVKPVQGESMQFSAVSGVRKLKERTEMLPGALVFEPAAEASLSRGVDPGALPAETVLSLSKVARITFRSVTWKWDGNVNSGTELDVTYTNEKKETFSAESFQVAFEREDGLATNLYWSWKLAEIVIAPAGTKVPAR